MPKDYLGAEITPGMWALFAHTSGRTAQFGWRYIHKVEGNQVWTCTTDEEGARASKVFYNRNLLMMDKPEEVL